MLRQAENRIKLEGILSETDLKYGSFVKNGDTVESIGGSIKVLVEQTVNGNPVTLEVPVHMFSTKYTRAGKINPAYESIERVMNEFVSIASCGSKENADRVRITGAEMRVNEFYGQGGTLISTPRVNTSFVSRAIGEFKPEASFVMEFMVSDINRVVDADGAEVSPAKLAVDVIVPQYGGRVDTLKLYATSPNVINAIENYWEAGQCYKASGRLNFSSTTRTVREEVDFGEPIECVQTISVSEFIITGGSQVPLDEELAFSVNDIKTAMAERKNRLEELKARGSAKQTPAQNTSKGKLDLGF